MRSRRGISGDSGYTFRGLAAVAAETPGALFSSRIRVRDLLEGRGFRGVVFWGRPSWTLRVWRNWQTHWI